MKKLLALIPAVMVLTACNTSNVAQPSPSQVQAVLANSQTFKCDNNAEVVSVITQRDGVNYANIQITAPTLSLNQAPVQLKQDVAASGNRFTVSNSTVGYDWHVKGGEAALTVTSQGQEINFGCMAQ
ncbi:putative lipoprotein [Moraxella macacae 0408225]|uniref:Putative lipoprotein n=1 Tax=Moraxella macacae 0408225 TaxID=1230338 RepID=L2F529_9GAMM|nr:MliC family protein [Moraxella macacae]ELA08144.1 putative lipoprotein [Moraxella macacae 0408225]